MGFFDFDHFDLDDDDWFVEGQLMAGSRREAIDLTGDDSFYPGDDGEEGLDDDTDLDDLDDYDRDNPVDEDDDYEDEDLDVEDREDDDYEDDEY